MSYKADDIKRQAAGRWVSILESVCGLAGHELNPRVQGPCPKCGGTDRYRALNDVAETGALFCNQCHNGDTSPRSGDGLAAVQWLLGCTFPEALRQIADSIGHHQNGYSSAGPAKPVAKPKAELERKPVKAIEHGFLKFLEGKGRDKLSLLVERLNVSVESLQALGVGFNPDGNVWTFPERNADGDVAGICRRFQDGEKKMMFGHKHGLYFADNWRDLAGPVLIVEGGSDTAAAFTLGLCAIGRPSKDVPRDVLPELVELLKSIPAERGIIVVGENDQDLQHDDPRWPGKEGAERTARELTEALGRPIPWALPTKGTKDLRSWLKANPEATGTDFVDSLEIGTTQEQAPGETKHRTFEGKSAAELWDLADEPVQWLVENVFSCDQPTIFGAKQKSLKTTLLTDLAVSLASGLAWLGKFHVPRRRRVLFVTGEASEAAAIRKVKRAASCRKLRREDFTDSLRIEALTFPTLPSQQDCAAVADAVKEHGIEVVLLDPLYMGLSGLNTANLTEVGPAMRQFMAACRPANVIIAHHVKKTASFDDAPNLEDLSQAGIAEFAGNYWLMGRMSEYIGDGMHELAIRYGGRDEQFGLLKLEFDERDWKAAFTSLMDHREDQKARKETERVVAMTQKIVTELGRYPDGVSESKLAAAAGTRTDRGPFRTALNELEQRGAIVCLPEFKPPRSQPTKGWKLTQSS